MKILLMGHPNVGKSGLFNRLTGAKITESNYPGTTVDYTQGHMKLKGKDVEVVDVPGTFSLKPKDKAEEVAVKMFKESKGSVTVCVLDASKVERGLYLTLEIIEKGYPVIVALNMWDIAKDKEIDINVRKLEAILGVPVVPTVAISGEGIKEMVSRIDETSPVKIEKVIKRSGGTESKNPTIDERWDIIDRISNKVIEYGKYEHTLKDAIAELTVKPYTGIPVAIAVLYGFWAFFGAFAGFFTDGFFVKLFDVHWLPWLQDNFPGEGGWVYYILVGDPAADNCFEAFGMLTSGLFVAIGVVLPAIIAFYLFLIILEDSGYLPRLAVLIDTLLHKIGLHGFAIVPLILSLGCNVPAVTATRTLETKKQRFMMMVLLSVFIPCGAQLGIMIEVIPDYVGFIMFYLFLGFFVWGYILNKIIPGKSPEILLDVPPYQRPMLRNVGRKLWLRTKSFFTVAIPFVLLGVVIVNLLYLGGVLDWLANIFEPVLMGWFGVPKETVGPLIAAFLRKDLAVAQLSAIEMTTYQLITAVVLVSLYFPCVATFAMIIKEGKESGWKGVVRIFFGSMIVLIVIVFLWGGLLHLLWILLGVG